MTARLLACLTAALFLISCEDPRNTVVPPDVSQWESEPDLKAAVEKLNDDEKRLFATFAMRRSLGRAFGGEGIAAGTTIADAIEAQRSWEAEQQLERLKQEELAKRLEAERVEALREMNGALTATLTEFGFLPSNPGQADTPIYSRSRSDSRTTPSVRWQA